MIAIDMLSGHPVFLSLSFIRRVVKLYSTGRHFLCRHCYRLPYSSKNDSDWDRALRQRTKSRRRLGENGDLSVRHIYQLSN
jgi:hypothetical protein